ncbi:MAG: diacylglycerol kinase [Thermodesulfovibrionales bacterium]
MPVRQWIRSANFAIEGILQAARTQRHLRYHFYAAAAVLLFSYAAGVTKIHFLIISLAVIAVLLAEMLNTAMESVVDLLSPDRHDKARAAKDIAAGAVFITAFGAAIIGYVVLMPYARKIFDKGLRVAKHTSEEISIIALVLVLMVVVLMKSRLGKGHPLSGGMPSGHAALAFAAWVAVTFITENLIASILCFLLAAGIARSRVTQKIHGPWEVFVGALIGSLITFALFRVFS